MAVLLEVTCIEHIRDEQVRIHREVANWNVGISGLLQAVLASATATERAGWRTDGETNKK